MTLTQSLAALIAGLVILAGSLAAYMNALPMLTVGSVSVSNEYNSTTTGESAEIVVPATLRVRAGVLGSVTVTGAATGDILLYDATTTDNTLRRDTATSSILVAHIPNDAAAGTYVFDIFTVNGLLLDVVGIQPTSTITFR